MRGKDNPHSAIIATGQLAIPRLAERVAGDWLVVSSRVSLQQAPLVVPVSQAQEASRLLLPVWNDVLLPVLRVMNNVPLVLALRGMPAGRGLGSFLLPASLSRRIPSHIPRPFAHAVDSHAGCTASWVPCPPGIP